MVKVAINEDDSSNKNSFGGQKMEIERQKQQLKSK